MTKVAASILGLVVLAAVLAPVVSFYDRDEGRLEEQYQPPSGAHWMGTDALGRDIMARILHGGRVSFAVGLCATLVSILIGVSSGAVAGKSGGRLDGVMMRIVDVLYGLPFMFFVVILIVVLKDFKESRLYIMFLALGAVQWLTMARIVRCQVLSIKEKEYVLAARALGAKGFHIVTRHILPNIIGPVIAYATLTIPAVIIEESFLSFLGLGVEAPACSWGSLLGEASRIINPVRTSWWMVLFPAAFLSVTLLCLNHLGDALRDSVAGAT